MLGGGCTAASVPGPAHRGGGGSAHMGDGHSAELQFSKFERGGKKPSRLANPILLLHPLWKYHSAIAVNMSLHFCTRLWLHSSFPDLSSEGCARGGEAKLSLEPLHFPPSLLKDRRW